MNDAVLESVTCGNTQVDSRNAHIVFNKMSTPDPGTGQTGYDNQFTVRERPKWLNNCLSLRFYSR